MDCKQLATYDICARHGDYLNSLIFTYSEPISSGLFFIDLKDQYGRVIKRYSLDDGLSFYSANQLLWQFGNVIEIPAGDYSYAVKSVKDEKPQTEFGGKFIVKKELTKWI